MILSLSVCLCQVKVTINNSYITEAGGANPTLGGKAIYIVVYNPNPNAIAPGNGWIVSENEFDMVRWYINTNTGDYIVPFGCSTTNALPLSFNISSAGSGSGWIDFSTWHTVADNWMGTVSLNGPPSDVKNMGSGSASGSPSVNDDSYNAVDRFWVIDASSYTTKPSLGGILFDYISNTGAPSEVSAPNVFAENNLAAQRFNPNMGVNGTWADWMGLGGTDVVAGSIGTVNSGAVSSSNFYRSWTLTNSLDPLPISISSLTSMCDNGAALIQWTSQTELNNATYTVKKTQDDIHFETVATISGAGNSSLPLNYQVTDDSPFAGQSYYFLFQTDFDGNTSAANIPFTIFTGCGAEALTAINAYNTTSYIEVQINSTQLDNYTISLVNILGQTVLTEAHSVSLGNNEIRLNNNFSPGIYILNIRNDKENYSKKMVIGVK